MKHLIEQDADGITSGGDFMPGFEGRSEFSVMAEMLATDCCHDAIARGDDPAAIHVRLEIANKIAALRISKYLEATGLTQGQLAAQIGVDRSHLNRITRLKATISRRAYEALFECELIGAILKWVEAKPEAERDHFEALLAESRIPFSLGKLLYVLGAAFGPRAWQSFRDSTGSLTDLPARDECPDALLAALRAEDAV